MSFPMLFHLQLNIEKFSCYGQVIQQRSELLPHWTIGDVDSPKEET